MRLPGHSSRSWRCASAWTTRPSRTARFASCPARTRRRPHRGADRSLHPHDRAHALRHATWRRRRDAPADASRLVEVRERATSSGAAHRVRGDRPACTRDRAGGWLTGVRQVAGDGTEMTIIEYGYTTEEAREQSKGGAGSGAGEAGRSRRRLSRASLAFCGGVPPRLHGEDGTMHRWWLTCTVGSVLQLAPGMLAVRLPSRAASGLLHAACDSAVGPNRRPARRHIRGDGVTLAEASVSHSWSATQRITPRRRLECH
jgi:hypothetical protein